MNRVKLLLAFALLIGILLSAPFAFSQLGYELKWWTVDSGGIQDLTSGGYNLSGTTGQPDADMLQNGEYKLISGFWQSPPKILVFFPIAVKE